MTSLVTKPLALDETLRQTNEILKGFSSLENAVRAEQAAATATTKATEASASASVSATSASASASSAAEAKSYRDGAAAIVTPDGLAAKVNENTDNISRVNNSINELAIIKISKNLLNKNTVLSDTSIPTASNTNIDAIESNPNYDLTGVIPVLNGKTYCFYGHTNTSYKPHIMIYDKDGFQKAHGDMTLIDDQNSIWRYTNNYGTQARIRYSNSCQMDINDFWFGVEGEYDSDVIPYGSVYKKLKEDVIVPQVVQGNSDLYEKLHGKNILNYGDSIALGAGNNGKSYAHLIADKYGMGIIDRSASGSTIHSVSGRGRITGRVTGDGTYPNIDYVFLEGGYNDLNDSSNSWLGSISNDYNMPTDFAEHFINSLEACFSTFKTNYPKAKVIYIITPKIRNSFSPIWNGTDLNFNALRKAIIDTCEKWSVVYVDLFTKSPFNSMLAQYYQYTLSNDGIHPTQEGYELFYIPWILKEM